jgi:pimeloyl-ACP methyl ester carboxylesterase
LANVFSTGLDVMNDRMRAKGINSRVDNHSVWQAWADEIIRRNEAGQVSFPIVIMGHSLGGNASVQMARYLGDRGIKVAYVAAFDPTITTEPGPNVARVDNFFIPNRRNGEAVNIVREGPGFTGTIANIDVTPMAGVDHFNIEKQPQLQDRVISIAMKNMKSTFRGSAPGENR